MNTSSLRAAVLAVSAICAVSGPCAASVISRPVPADGGPTPVYVAFGLLDIDEVNSAEQNFTANLFISARWHDPRLAHDEPGERILPLDDVWNPRFLFVNQQKIWPTMPMIVRVSPSGEVEYQQRIWGPFSQPLQMKNFPFDHQDFAIRVAATGHHADTVRFEMDRTINSGLAPEFSLPDWDITGWRLDFSPYHPTGARTGVASFALVISARRHSAHYVLKTIVPLILIVAMSCIVFWIDPGKSGTQVGVATTSMLTLIAYRFMVGSETPPVPYLTRMDKFILGSTVLVFTVLVQAVLTSMLADHDRAPLARRFDLWCRLLFPAFFAAFTAYALLLS